MTPGVGLVLWWEGESTRQAKANRNLELELVGKQLVECVLTHRRPIARAHNYLLDAKPRHDLPTPATRVGTLDISGINTCHGYN